MHKKIHLILFFQIVILLLCTRFFKLQIFPVGLWHDEVEYSLSARAFWLFGEDVSGVKIPDSFFYTKTDSRFAEITPIIFSPFYAFSSFTQMTARVPFTILSCFTGIILYFIVISLFKKRKMALLTMFVYAVNPWAVFFGRTGTEAWTALFFYLIGLLILLRTNDKKILIALPFFILGFFSYHAAKYVLLPMVAITLLYKFYFNKLLDKKILSILFISVVFLTLGYYLIFIRLSNSPISNRRSNTALFNQEYLSDLVNIKRRLAVQKQVNPIFINKPIVEVNLLIERALSVFSSDFLYISGDERAVYKFGDHGVFYYLDLIFIVFGLCILFLFSKKLFIYLLGLLICGLIPSSVSLIEKSYVFRSFLVFPLLFVLIALGIWFISGYNLMKKHLNMLLKIIITVLISLSLVRFLHFYFFRFPVAFSENFFLSEKIIAQYLNFNLKQNPNIKTVVISDLPYLTYLEFVYFNNIFKNINDARIVRDNIKSQKYNWKNISFTAQCPDSSEIQNNKETLYIINIQRGCSNSSINTLAVVSLKDAGEIFKIYNDGLCQNSSQRYSVINDFKAFDIESMDQKHFCDVWIAKVN